jgi:hypothetical protein
MNRIIFTYLLIGILPSLLNNTVHDMYRTTLRNNSPLPLTEQLSDPNYVTPLPISGD